MAMYNQSQVSTGLTTTTYTAPFAGQYMLRGKLTLPMITTGSTPSSVVVTITNGTGPVTLYTGTAGVTGFQIDTVCAAGDVISIALTSAATVDQALNAIKMTTEFASGILE